LPRLSAARAFVSSGLHAMDRLKAIGTFVQIARSQSLSRAADELGISRALASTHLKQLEQHLGVRLVNRTTRQLALTDAGAEYLSFCTEMLDRFEAHEASVSRGQSEPKGNLKIMASMAFAQFEVAPIIAGFTARHPKVKVALNLCDHSFSPSDFIESGHDLGIATHSIGDAGIISSRIAGITWVPCGSHGYLKNRPEIEHPSDLADHNCLIHRSHAPDAVWRFSRGRECYDVSVSGSMFTNSAMVLRMAVLSGAGIAMLPLYAIGEDVQNGRLVPILPDYESEKRPVYVVYPDSRYLPKRSRLFIDYLREQLRSKKL
jgi:DNA-binding transcriptional LysR family regulator